MRLWLWVLLSFFAGVESLHAKDYEEQGLLSFAVSGWKLSAEQAQKASRSGEAVFYARRAQRLSFSPLQRASYAQQFWGEQLSSFLSSLWYGLGSFVRDISRGIWQLLFLIMLLFLIVVVRRSIYSLWHQRISCSKGCDRAQGESCHFCKWEQLRASLRAVPIPSLLLVALSLFFSGRLLSQAGMALHEGVVVEATELRSGPDETFELVGKVDPGSFVLAEEWGADKVRLKSAAGREGWANRSCVRLVVS